MKTDIEKIMEIIDLYPHLFPHLTKQPFKIKWRLESKTNYGYLLNDGAFILYEISINRSKIISKTPHYKKKGDMVLHQIGSNGKVKGAAKQLLEELIKLCKSNFCENIILSVRKDNIIARNFYERNDFKLIYESDRVWKERGNYIGGCIYKLSITNTNKLNEFIKK